jgi:hypothetical protein
MRDKGSIMETNKILHYIMEKTERAFRLVIPGFLFLFLLYFSFPILFGKIISNANAFIVLVAALVSGSCVYVLHRVVFEVIDTLFYERRYNKIAEVFIYNEDNKAEYGLYKWASLHLPMMISELFLFFSIFNEPQSQFDLNAIKIRIVFGFFMVISLIAYYYMHRIQKEIYRKKGIDL